MLAMLVACKESNSIEDGLSSNGEEFRHYFSGTNKDEVENPLTLAEQGDVDAQFRSGMVYFWGVNTDREKAEFWLTKAAEQGHAEAQLRLGQIYNRKNTYKDYKQTMFWFQKAAEQGNAEAQLRLGLLLLRGRAATQYAVPQDYRQAVFWLKKAAEQNDEYAESAAQFLGFMYHDGDGVPQDYKQAAFWLKKAAEKGNALTQSTLGIMYFNGEGVPQNYILSYIWLNVAVANMKPGQEELKEIIKSERDIVEAKLTKEQLIEAQGRANRCWESNYQAC